MGSNKVNLTRFYNTLRYLKPIQVFYQVWYRLLKKLKNQSGMLIKAPTSTYLEVEFIPINPKTYLKNNSFCFLNIPHTFSNQIEWNISKYGKLWTYNLSYFEFLNQPSISREDGMSKIKEFASGYNWIKDGLDPYPSSLRIINCIKFIANHNILDKEIDDLVYSDLQRLSNNIEYHILANHLLENVFALLFGSIYFRDDKLYRKAANLVKQQLEEQILEDGGHYELSPMYHSIILFRLLDTIQLLNNSNKVNDEIVGFIKMKASMMLSWISMIQFKNGDLPMVNDCSIGITITPDLLLNYGEKLSLLNLKIPLGSSGYRKNVVDKFELFLDIGNIKPSYQPGHNHSDTFNTLLYYSEKPILVDSGTSTYEDNAVRAYERSTLSHNTVSINKQNSSQIWGSFRVGNRANIIFCEEEDSKIRAQHNGFQKYDIVHERIWSWTKNVIIIEDYLSKRSDAQAFFHFYPSIQLKQISGTCFEVKESLNFTFEGAKKILVEASEIAVGFNHRVTSQKLTVEFDHFLKTRIEEIS